MMHGLDMAFLAAAVVAGALSVLPAGGEFRK